MKLDYIQIIPGIKIPYKFFDKVGEGRDYRTRFIGWKKYSSQIKGEYELRISINFILFTVKFILSRIATEKEIEKQLQINQK